MTSALIDYACMVLIFASIQHHGKVIFLILAL